MFTGKYIRVVVLLQRPLEFLLFIDRNFVLLQTATDRDRQIQTADAEDFSMFV